MATRDLINKRTKIIAENMEELSVDKGAYLFQVSRSKIRQACKDCGVRLTKEKTEQRITPAEKKICDRMRETLREVYLENFTEAEVKFILYNNRDNIVGVEELDKGDIKSAKKDIKAGLKQKTEADIETIEAKTENNVAQKDLDERKRQYKRYLVAIEKKQKEYQTLLTAKGQLDTEKDNLQREYDDVVLKKTTLETDISDLSEQKTTLQTDVTDLSTKKTTLETDCIDLETKKEEALNDREAELLRQIKTNKESSDKEIEDLKDQLLRKTGEIKLLNSKLTAKEAEYNKSIEDLLKQANEQLGKIERAERKQAGDALKAAKEEYQQELEKLKRIYENQVSGLQEKHQKDFDTYTRFLEVIEVYKYLVEQRDLELVRAEEDYTERFKDLKEDAEAQITDLKETHQKEHENLKAVYENQAKQSQGTTKSGNKPGFKRYFSEEEEQIMEDWFIKQGKHIRKTAFTEFLKKSKFEITPQGLRKMMERRRVYKRKKKTKKKTKK